jgi:large subunit ribosomal protein L4
MVFDKYSINGKVIGKVEASDSVFKAEVNDNLIYEMIKAANANLRQGTHSTKRRAEVSGGGIKPYRQKGTGRARQGSIRAPQWKGGGIVFGPHPREYKIELPRKIKEKAMISLLSLKAKEGAIKVVEDFKVKDGKTKEMAVIGKALEIKKGVLITEGEDKLTKLAIRNIPWFVYNNAKRMSSRDIFYSKTIVITESAVNYLNNRYAKG